MRNRFTILVFAFAASACASSSTTSTTEKKAAAEGTYGAELQACVQVYDSGASIDTCAAGVRARWASKDGGAQ